MDSKQIISDTKNDSNPRKKIKEKSLSCIVSSLYFSTYIHRIVEIQKNV